MGLSRWYICPKMTCRQWTTKSMTSVECNKFNMTWRLLFKIKKENVKIKYKIRTDNSLLLVKFDCYMLISTMSLLRATWRLYEVLSNRLTCPIKVLLCAHTFLHLNLTIYDKWLLIAVNYHYGAKMHFLAISAFFTKTLWTEAAIPIISNLLDSLNKSPFNISAPNLSYQTEYVLTPCFNLIKIRFLTWSVNPDLTLSWSMIT